MTPVRLEPAASRSRVKHSTTEPLRTLNDTTELLIYTSGGEMTGRGNDKWGNPKARISRDMSLK